MNAKKIIKLIGTTALAFSFLFTVQMFSCIQVKAETINSTLQSESESASVPDVLISEQINYSIPINKSFEDKGIKIEIKDIIASKNEMKVKTLIHRNDSLNEIDGWNDIISLVVQNSDADRDYYIDCERVDNQTVEYTFNIYNFTCFENSVDLRFDVLLPEYDFNGWVKTSVDISRFFDLTIEENLNFNMDNYNFYKLKSNVIGTKLFFKDNTDYDFNDKAYGFSGVLLKYKDKMYALKDGYISFYDFESECPMGSFATKAINYDDLKAIGEYSVILIENNLKESELEDYYNSRNEEEPVYEIKNNVKYESKLNFKDKTSVNIYKVERSNDKVKVYYNADSYEKGILAGFAMFGGYDYSQVNYRYHSEPNKVIYKNSSEENSYIVEFDKVLTDKTFVIESDKLILANSDKFNVHDEIKIK